MLFSAGYTAVLYRIVLKCLMWYVCGMAYLAPDEAERPDRNDVDDCSERNTHDDEHEIGGGESNDENVGRISHGLIGGDHDDDRQVPDEAEHGDETEDDRDDDTNEVLEDDVRAAAV